MPTISELIDNLHEGFQMAVYAVEVQIECDQLVVDLGEIDPFQDTIHEEGCGCNILLSHARYQDGCRVFYGALTQLQIELGLLASGSEDEP